MNALYSVGQTVPLSRVVREHRAALLPLGLVLALNLLLLIIVVLPLSRSVAASEQRVQAAEREQLVAAKEFAEAEALREGKTRAMRDLDMFYDEVLPSSVTSARRLFLKMQVLARNGNLEHRRTDTVEEEFRDSSLRRVSAQMALSGDYDDIRALIYEIETSPDFVVIDRVVLAEGQDENAPLAVSMGVSTYYRVRPGATQNVSDGR